MQGYGEGRAVFLLVRGMCVCVIPCILRALALSARAIPSGPRSSLAGARAVELACRAGLAPRASLWRNLRRGQPSGVRV